MLHSPSEQEYSQNSHHIQLYDNNLQIAPLERIYIHYNDMIFCTYNIYMMYSFFP